MAHQVVLQWVDSTDAGAEYNVYRSTTSTFSGSPLNTSPLAAGTTTYTDNSSTLTAGQWFYAVTAIENGVESAKSSPASVSLPPAIPTGLVVVSFE